MPIVGTTPRPAYIYDLETDTWVPVAGAVGPTGPTGPAGPTGPIGATGPSALTTKGDLATYSTSVTRLPIGSNNQVLIPDSSTATGLRWSDDVAVLQIMQAI